MKTKNLLLGALAMLALSACSDDKSAAPDLDYSKTAFIRVNFLGNSALGRAEDDTDVLDDSDFQDGTVDENEIQSALLAFYDAYGNFLTSAPVTKANITNTPQPNDPNISVIKTVETTISLKEGKIPSYMMVYANPVTSLAAINWSLNELKSSTITTSLTQVTGDDNSSKTLIAMNNAVYFNDKKVLQRAVEVSRANFYQTEDEKKTAEAVDVYLERVAAKVTLTQADNLKGHTGTIDGKKLTFHITGWGINALAKKCYVTKRFNDREYDNIDLSFFWNDPDRCRSYWAMSPHYNDGTYPFVSDQVGDVNNQENNSYSLKYRPFKNMNRAAGSYVYALENTVFGSYYNGGDGKVNANAALASVVIAGYYSLGDATEGTTFYLYGSKLYDQPNLIRELAKQGAVVVKKIGEKDGVNEYTTLSDEDAAAIFEIYHPTTPAVGDEKKGVEENNVTIRFKTSATNSNTVYYYKNGNSEAQLITTDNRATVNKEIQANTGHAIAYTDGKAYFSVPIRHLAAEPAEGGAWSNGSFGLVRNHHYLVNIEAFAPLSETNLGHGVFDPEKPIVPPSDPNDEFGVKANIKVLSWRIVNQNVTLGD
ncbi:MAG: Mfa1 family fimbria major subunit [Muribaculaceae bacterium]|nr:Mfa1 family fimbria major subunit [Muribaculaceae bacterium]